MMTDDDVYVELLLAPLRKCAAYKPAFGRAGNAGTTLEEFQALYGSDPLYHWVGLDSDLMYAAHKAAGGMTSIYRQLGVGCERFFREAVRRSLDLSDDEATWGYEAPTDEGKTARLTLDARIDLEHIEAEPARARVDDWLKRVSSRLRVDPEARRLHGAVFEVRQGYKSADSKRQNADLRSGMRAYAEGYLPVVMLFSRQVNQTVERRYRGAGLLVLVGSPGGPDTESTYSFCREVVGFDAVGFFERNADRLRSEFIGILSALLTPA